MGDLTARVRENIEFEMPWLLMEQLHKAKAAASSGRIAEIGLCALSLEDRTKFTDKAIAYATVWSAAYDTLSSDLDNRGDL
jgi:hypothetical protein